MTGQEMNTSPTCWQGADEAHSHSWHWLYHLPRGITCCSSLPSLTCSAWCYSIYIPVLNSNFFGVRKCDQSGVCKHTVLNHMHSFFNLIFRRKYYIHQVHWALIDWFLLVKTAWHLTSVGVGFFFMWCRSFEISTPLFSFASKVLACMNLVWSIECLLVCIRWTLIGADQLVFPTNLSQSSMELIRKKWHLYLRHFCPVFLSPTFELPRNIWAAIN